jgi:long-subunit fatty acid transport protein
VTASFGAMVRPTHHLSFGLDVRGPADLGTSGTATIQAPRITPNAGFQPSSATLDVKLPTVVRLGGRYIFLKDGFEVGDVELDGTYEAWGEAQGDGLSVSIPKVDATNPPPGVNLTNVDFVSPHHYHDSWSLRTGGAYNVPISHAPRPDFVTLRAGAYYDVSPTDVAYTRLDFDTLDKIAGTLGAGVTLNTVTVNVAYAEIFDVTRTVDDGALRPLNGTQHGASTDSSGALYPAVNNGTYSGHSRILSLGVTVRFDALLGKKRESPVPGSLL